MQALLPTSGISTALQNNYIAPNATGLINWSMTDRIDYSSIRRDTLTFIAAMAVRPAPIPSAKPRRAATLGRFP